MGKIKVGADPEFVAKNRRGRPVAAPNVFKFTKDNQHRSHGGSVFADNANIEMNIPPAETAKDFQKNILAMLRVTQTVIGSKYSLAALASLDYPKSELNNDYCRQFGCEPDYDAFLLVENTVPEGAADSTFRSAGGHVHIGRNQGYNFLDDPYGKVDVVKAFEAFVGIPSVILDNDPASVKRRKLYGKAGCHRPKPYGVECRSLSNFWLRHPALAKFIFEATTLSVKAVDEGVAKKLDLNKLPDIINGGRIKDAREYMKGVTDYYPELATMFYEIQHLTSAKTRFISMKKAWGY